MARQHRLDATIGLEYQVPLDVKVSDEMVAKGAEAVSAEVAAAMKQARDLAVPGLAPLESETPGLDFCPHRRTQSRAPTCSSVWPSSTRSWGSPSRPSSREGGLH